MNAADWIRSNGGAWPADRPPRRPELVRTTYARLRDQRTAEALEICRRCPDGRYREPRHCDDVAAVCGCGGGSVVAWLLSGNTCPRGHWPQ